MATATTFRKIVATKLSPNFREATSIVTVPFPKELRPTELLVRNVFAGINASDINFTAGIYQPDVQPPFDCGFEALGEVVEVGKAVKGIAVGDAVVTQSYGGFSEYQVVPRRHAKKAPSLRKEWLPLDLSGTTASIALDEVLRPQKGERAVVTAASGGTGHIAVQLLKQVYGCAVVGTCSSAAKATLLTELHCDGVVNYRETPSVADAIRTFYPHGANIAYESVGGDLLEAVVHSLAFRGRVLAIGSISSYTSEGQLVADRPRKPLPLQLLSRSATLHTFFLPHFAKHAPAHFDKLCGLCERGVVQSHIDPTPFHGLESVYDAIDCMYNQKNSGKVIVTL